MSRADMQYVQQRIERAKLRSFHRKKRNGELRKNESFYIGYPVRADNDEGELSVIGEGSTPNAAWRKARKYVEEQERRNVEARAVLMPVGSWEVYSAAAEMPSTRQAFMAGIEAAWRFHTILEDRFQYDIGRSQWLVDRWLSELKTERDR